MRDYDTVSYHMPFAARFAQDASITAIQYTGNPPVSFYPANSELIHAVGIVLLHRDVLSPVLNLAWLALALLAAWCIGRPFGLGPGTMSAAAMMTALNGMAGTQGGTAKNDILALGLGLAALALLVDGGALRRGRARVDARGVLILAALASGLAVGTRLTLWITVLPLLAASIFAAGTGRRRGAAGWWLGGLVVGGSFWYLRNLFATGNPMPWIDIRLGGLVHLRSAGPPLDCGTTSVAHYLSHPGFIGAHLVPQLGTPFGASWWLPLGIAVAGLLGGVVQSAVPVARILALVGLVTVAGYLLTPATAGGVGARCFAFDTRFAVPGLVLGAMAVPLLLDRFGIHPLVAVGLALLAVVVNANLTFAPRVVLMALAIMALVVILVLRAWRFLPGPAVGLLVIALLAAAALGGLRETRVYLNERYQQPLLEEPLDSPFSRFAHLTGARIAVTGADEVYPLYGAELSNRVDNLARRVDGTRFVFADSCTSWVRALVQGRYDYVVIAHEGRGVAPQAGWTRRYPHARELLASPPDSMRRGHSWQWELFGLPGASEQSITSC
jgi:hypothetical protein